MTEELTELEQPPRILTPMPPEIAAGIVKVQRSIKKLAKTSENKYQRYSYASIDDFLEAVGPLEAEAGIFILPEEAEESTIESAKADRESGSLWLKIRWAFTIGHESGALYGPLHRTVMVPAVGAQAYGSAQSYALKQFQRGLYKIPTGDGDDPDAHQAQPLPQTPAKSTPDRNAARRVAATPAPNNAIFDWASADDDARLNFLYSWVDGERANSANLLRKCTTPAMTERLSRMKPAKRRIAELFIASCLSDNDRASYLETLIDRASGSMEELEFLGEILPKQNLKPEKLNALIENTCNYLTAIAINKEGNHADC